AAQPEVRVPQISVLGISLGAYLAVGVAATDPRVAATVIVAGGLEPFLRDRIKRLPPTLILHGDKDGTVAVSEGLELAAFLRARHIPVQVHIYPGEDHSFSDSVAVDALARARRFLWRKRSSVPAPHSVVAPVRTP